MLGVIVGDVGVVLAVDDQGGNFERCDIVCGGWGGDFKFGEGFGFFHRRCPPVVREPGCLLLDCLREVGEGADRDDAFNSRIMGCCCKGDGASGGDAEDSDVGEICGFFEVVYRGFNILPFVVAVGKEFAAAFAMFSKVEE